MLSVKTDLVSIKEALVTGIIVSSAMTTTREGYKRLLTH